MYWQRCAYSATTTRILCNNDSHLILCYHASHTLLSRLAYSATTPHIHVLILIQILLLTDLDTDTDTDTNSDTDLSEFWYWSMHASVHLSIHACIRPSVHSCMHLSIRPSMHPSIIWWAVHINAGPSVCLLYIQAWVLGVCTSLSLLSLACRYLFSLFGNQSKTA